VRTFPVLRDASVVRTWAGLRVMSPDGFPIYEQSAVYPGAFAVTCHSGVTLAGAHALALAPAILGGALPAEFAAFSSSRFRQAA
jgi:glycine/D-amino acid oxidase-like deaminating enzyme